MPLHGVMVVDKPGGWTSHDVVARCRKLLAERSIGHLGTLDPMATGVLPLVIGRMTRLSQFYSGSQKRYQGIIRLGISTDTYDADGEPVGPERDVEVTLEDMTNLARQFLGRLQQVPPPFSAKKIKGVPAYKLARRKAEVELKPVEVEIFEFNVRELRGAELFFACRVSSGTYVRSLAHEIGQKLGCGAHLSSLRRTAVAEFDIAQAHTLDEIAQGVTGDRLADLLIHPRRLLPDLPSVTADDEALGRIRTGRTVNLPEMSRSKWVKVFADQTELVCLASRVAGTLFHPKVVLV
jgi:tRNA pseudouridine55 synthase